MLHPTHNAYHRQNLQTTCDHNTYLLFHTFPHAYCVPKNGDYNDSFPDLPWFQVRPLPSPSEAVVLLRHHLATKMRNLKLQGVPKKVYNRILVVVAAGSLVNTRLQGDGQLHEDSVHWLKIMLRTSPCRRACAQAANRNHHQNSIMNFFLGHPVLILHPIRTPWLPGTLLAYPWNPWDHELETRINSRTFLGQFVLVMFVLFFVYLFSVFVKFFVCFSYLFHRTCSWPFKHQDNGWDGGTKRWC